jgi:hypothetical protein
MDKVTARRRKAAKAARVPGQPGQPGAIDQLPGAQLDDSPTGLALAAEDEEDIFTAEERAERQAQEDADRQARLDTFGAALGTKRTSAVEARRASGIEEIWRQDEEFYEGIDDANRGETVTLKPRDPNGAGGTSLTSTDEAIGSNVFMNITRAYVDFSAGRACDMLLPTDEANWDLRPTPMPDVIALMTSDKPLTMPPGVQLKPGAPSTIGEAATQMVNEAHKKVAKAKTRIEDWLEEGQFSAEQRKVIRDAAKVGVGILKGPFPSKRMARAIVRDEQTGDMTMQVQNKTAPESRCISYWNFYPDPACGEDIHRGSFVWEKDRITARQLRDLKGTKDSDGNPMYLEDTITRCLEEGPQRRYADDDSYRAPDGEQYEIWYYHGVANAEDLRAAGIDADDGEVLPVMVTMVNDRVIKAALSTLDSGSFPYDVMVWQERENHWAGIGVSRQVRSPQRIVNAGVRNLMDNAGLAAGPQFVMMKGALKPLGRGAKYGISPRKMWELDPDSSIDDVRKAFAAIELPMLAEQLLNIVNFGLKMAEDVTGMSMLLQGQQGSATTTVGGMNILTNNSNTPLRAIAKLFDDRITVPHLLRYYEWLLMYGPEADEKGDYIVAARGSSALFERDAQNQAILQMAQFVKDPDFRINPEKWFKEYLRAQRLDPDRFQYSDVEWKLKQKQMEEAGPPPDPRLEAAKIAAQARVQTATIAAQVQEKRIQTDMDRDGVFAQAENERTQLEHQARMQELALKRELAMLDYANTRQISLEQVKADLASTTMKLQTQERLAAANAHGPQVTAPPTEPPGRASNGQAYQA